MATILRGRCPACQAVLRIPQDWLTQMFRCTHCGAVVRSRGLRPAGSHAVCGTAIGVESVSTSSVGLPTSWYSPSGSVISDAHGLPTAVIPPSAAPIGASAPLITSTSRYRRRTTSSIAVQIVVVLLAVGLFGIGVTYFRKHLRLDEWFAGSKPSVTDPSDHNNASSASGDKTDTKQKQPPAATVAFPRRMLVLNIDNYMFLNPLTSSPPGLGDRVRAAANRWAFEWHIPMDRENSQVYVLSDTLPERLLPVKSVLSGVYESFFETCRSQDRIVVYFSGHALFKDGAAYLAPIEADPDELGTFIPLADFYSKLQQCRATQKVVVWDVCRYNPERGIIRPGSEPMSQELYEALKKAPPGVEVVITCQPGENALEFSSVTLSGSGRPQTYAGSAFMIANRIAAERKRGVVQAPHPNDPLPVENWLPEVQQRLQEVLEAVRVEKKQTLQAHGERPQTLTASNPHERAAAGIVFPPAPKTASPAEVAAIVSEFQLPPIKQDVGTDSIANFPFDPERLAVYRDPISVKEILANKQQYRLRAAVLQAYDEIRDIWQGNPATGGRGQLPDTIKAPITDELKKEIFAGLDFYAEGIARLELIDATLDSLETLRAGETPRWQAHFDYARAAVKTRLAFLNEYNKVMGNVRTNTLPTLDPKLGQNQYKLASSNRMRSGKEVERMVEQARALYANIIQEHKGTPWAIAAKREKNLSLGLMWQPSSDKKADD